MDKIGRINPLIEALKAVPLRVTKIFIQKDTERKRITEVIKMARSRNIPVVWVPKGRLDQMYKNNQGIVALLSPKAFSSVGSILSDSNTPFLPWTGSSCQKGDPPDCRMLYPLYPRGPLSTSRLPE
jgi:tRNA G18 (ribose-2'-O)-methylase SpoU